MGFFFSDSKSIHKDDLDKLLGEISALSSQEKEYVRAIFSRFIANGISKEEAQKVVREMRLNTHDELDSNEVEKIKLKILAFLV